MSASRCSASSATRFDFWRSERVLRRAQRARRGAARGGRPDASSRDMPAVELPYGRKRALEIATTLALDPEMMLLDEPMAGHGPRGHRPHRRADPAGRRRPHRADGRAQSVGRGRPVATRSRCWPAARSWPRATTTQVSKQSRGGRSLYGPGPCLMALAERPAASVRGPARLVRRVARPARHELRRRRAARS